MITDIRQWRRISTEWLKPWQQSMWFFLNCFRRLISRARSAAPAPLLVPHVLDLFREMQHVYQASQNDRLQLPLYQRFRHRNGIVCSNYKQIIFSTGIKLFQSKLVSKFSKLSRAISILPEESQLNLRPKFNV